MPPRVPHPCSRCHVATVGQYCERCLPFARVETRARRTQDHNHGGGGARWWRERRAEVLRRDPWCKLCHKAQSTVAEHRIPRRAGGSDGMDNLQGTCGPCASRKTAAQDGGFGNTRRAHNTTRV